MIYLYAQNDLQFNIYFDNIFYMDKIDRFVERFSNFTSNIILRFYSEIISGVWAILIVIPIDSYLNLKINHHSEYVINSKYFIFVFFYTIFFLIAAALVPYFKTKTVKKEVDYLTKRYFITEEQKKKIYKILDDVLVHKSIFSLEGFLQFIMLNLFCIDIILAYFGIEGFIICIMQNRSPDVYFIYMMLFVVILIIESFLDDFLSHKLKQRQIKVKILKRGKDHSINFRQQTSNKHLLAVILRNLGGGGSMSDKMSKLIVEESVEDIREILHISSAVTKVAKKPYNNKHKKKKSNEFINFEGNNYNYRNNKIKKNKKFHKDH